ncbi:DUF945 family protein [Campylobacter sp. RM16704]|uniref:DUF945 family protein n=1 Tax=Campylobacter sp. RM16704 TaxID=1500960 RepID=UPI00057EAE2E|nr:DUF945 family protein [Campylobacter sp. RM16704]AJC87002.1 putative protein (DUF945 domain) [Campylobacter sp. RM16704]
MKKIIAGVVVLVLLVMGFFTSAFYINSTNEKIFAQMSQDTMYYDVEDANYTKGFLNSKGSFIATLNDLSYSFKINVDFSNNFFASNNAVVSIINENEDLKGIFPNEEIAKILIGIKFGNKTTINAKVNDINTTRNNVNIIINNFNFVANTQDEFIKDMYLNISHFLLKQADESFELKNIKISEIPIGNLNFKDIFNPTRSSEQKINIEAIKFIDELLLNNCNIYAKTISNTQNNYDSILKINIKDFQLPKQQLTLNNIILDTNFNSISKEAYDALVQNSNTDIFSMMLLASQFLKANPEIILNTLSLEKENKKFNANGKILFTENVIKSQFHANTQILPSQIWSEFANFDTYFIDNNGSYVLDFIYDDSNKTDVKTIINGENLIINQP